MKKNNKKNIKGIPFLCNTSALNFLALEPLKIRKKRETRIIADITIGTRVISMA
jgi:hypothetical protein